MFCWARGKFVGEINKLSSFQVIKWLENEKVLLFWQRKRSSISGYEVIRAPRIGGPLGIHITLGGGTKSSRLLGKFHIKASACLHKSPVHGDQDGKASTLCFLPANQEHPLPWARVHPMVMRTATSRHGAWRAGLCQCLFIWVQIFITSAFQHLHMQTGDLKGTSCENTCLWPTLHTLYATSGCEFDMG